MVRTRSFDPSLALSKAMDLFSCKGYSETSMDDIVQATGVSRYGLYGTFGNKRDLFEAALEKFADRMGRKSFLRLLEPDAGLGHIRKIFAERVEDMCCSSDNQGCLFVHTTMGLAPKDDDLRGLVQKYMKGMTKAFSVGLDSAKAQGEIKADVDTWAAGEMLTSTMFGLAVMGRSGFPKETLEAIVENTLASLKN